MSVKTLSRTARPLLVALLGSLAWSAQAAEPLDRVEIAGQSVRTDVTRSCPAIAESLQAGVQREVYRVGRDGVYQVQFSLSGQQVAGVDMRGGPYEYRSVIRQAVRSLDCQDQQAHAKPQRYAFVLAIKADGDSGATVEINP